jgi:hypothetical protein
VQTPSLSPARAGRRLTHGARDPAFGKPRAPTQPAATGAGAAAATEASSRRLLQDDAAAPAGNVSAGDTQSLAAGASDLSCVGCSGYDTRTQVCYLPCMEVLLFRTRGSAHGVRRRRRREPETGAPGLIKSAGLWRTCPLCSCPPV